jgi:CRP-like cAMP-binding protein
VRLFTQDVKVETLKRASLFEGLSRKELASLARVTEDIEFEAGTELCREGSVGREFFVVVDGEVEVTRGGKFFGEIALLTEAKRTATVTAKTPLRCFVLTKRDFQRVLDENPLVERKVLRALAERLLDYADVV